MSTASEGLRKIELGDMTKRRHLIRRANRRLGWVIGIIAAIAIGLATLSLWDHFREEDETTEQRLQTFNTLRAGAVTKFLTAAEEEVRLWSASPYFTDKAEELFALWEELTGAERARVRDILYGGAPTGALTEAQVDYLLAHERYASMGERFLDTHKFYDLFFIAPDGDVAYTVELESDFGTNLQTIQSGLSDVFTAAQDADADTVVTSDFDRYAPSNGDMALFMASPMIGNGGRRIGTFAVQVSLGIFDETMNYNAGLGDSGKTLLVGADHKVRNAIEVDGERRYLVEIDDDLATDAALRGERYLGRTVGDRGQTVVAAARPLDFLDKRWALLTEKDLSEIRAPLRPFIWLYLAAVIGILIVAWTGYLILRTRLRALR